MSATLYSIVGLMDPRNIPLSDGRPTRYMTYTCAVSIPATDDSPPGNLLALIRVWPPDDGTTPLGEVTAFIIGSPCNISPSTSVGEGYNASDFDLVIDCISIVQVETMQYPIPATVEIIGRPLNIKERSFDLNVIHYVDGGRGRPARFECHFPFAGRFKNSVSKLSHNSTIAVTGSILGMTEGNEPKFVVEVTKLDYLNLASTATSSVASALTPKKKTTFDFTKGAASNTPASTTPSASTSNGNGKRPASPATSQTDIGDTGHTHAPEKDDSDEEIDLTVPGDPAGANVSTSSTPAAGASRSSRKKTKAN